MKSFFNHPYTKITVHVLLLLSLLYYCIIVAAVVWPFDDGWGISLLKGLPLFALFVFGWLYFYHFKVLRRTYQGIAVFSGTLFIILYYPFFPIKSLLHIGPKMNGGYYYAGMGISGWTYYFASVLNKHVLVWAPYIFFFIFLSRGLKLKCPKCKLVHGIYARQEINREHRGTSTRHGTETSETRRPYYYGPNNQGTIVERETRHVTYTTSTYEVFCNCKVCQHKWSYMHTTTTKS